MKKNEIWEEIEDNNQYEKKLREKEWNLLKSKFENISFFLKKYIYFFFNKI